MPTFNLYFETKIRGFIAIEADSEDAAEALGEEYADETVNYDELARHCAPSVETEFTDIYKVKEEK